MSFAKFAGCLQMEGRDQLNNLHGMAPGLSGALALFLCPTEGRGLMVT